MRQRSRQQWQQNVAVLMLALGGAHGADGGGDEEARSTDGTT